MISHIVTVRLPKHEHIIGFAEVIHTHLSDRLLWSEFQYLGSIVHHDLHLMLSSAALDVACFDTIDWHSTYRCSLKLHYERLISVLLLLLLLTMFLSPGSPY